MRSRFVTTKPRTRLAAVAIGAFALLPVTGCGGDDDDPTEAEPPLSEVFESPADTRVRYSDIELAGDLERVFIKVDSDPVAGVAGRSTLDCERAGTRVQSHQKFGSPRTPFVWKIDLKGRPAVEGTSDCVLIGSVKVQGGDSEGRLTVTVTEEP